MIKALLAADLAYTMASDISLLEENPENCRKIFFCVLDFKRTIARLNVVSCLEFNKEHTFEIDSADHRIVPAQELKELMMETGYRHFKDL